jgi:outer membrane lipoprotein-sorting protein
VTVHGRSEYGDRSRAPEALLLSFPRIVAIIDKRWVHYKTAENRRINRHIESLDITIHSPFVEKCAAIKNKEFYIVLYKDDSGVTLYNIDRNEITKVSDDFDSEFLPVPEGADILNKMIRVKTDNSKEEVVVKLKEILA